MHLEHVPVKYVTTELSGTCLKIFSVADRTMGRTACQVPGGLPSGELSYIVNGSQHGSF